MTTITKLIYPDESYAIRGAIYEVYREMGCGFLEAVYQECLERELSRRSVPFKARVPIGLLYKGEPLAHTYAPDLICYDRIIVEIKAVSVLSDEHHAQVHNYLKATGLHLGLLVNFCSYPKATIVRIAK